MQRNTFEPEIQVFRDSVRYFVANEILPFHARREEEGMVPREIRKKAGEKGFLCMDVEEQYGGAGMADVRYDSIVIEEIARAGASGVYFSLHTDVVVPYISRYATEQQKQRWLPRMASGDCIGAIAMTEPGAGSDLAGIRTTAVRRGNCYIVNGQKTFVSNGLLNDLVIAVVKTDPQAGHKGISLLVVERGAPGYERGKQLHKMGLHAQDTAELYFTDAHVPAENLLGAEGQGFKLLMQELPRERMSIAVGAIAAAQAAFDQTLQYAKDRKAFGQPIGSFQHSKFVFAEMLTEITLGQTFVDQCILSLNAGTLSTETASMAKWWTTEMLKRVVDQCVQLHGGYGYIMETPIARRYLDARVQTIFGGTTEIMKEIIGRSLGL